MSLLQAAPQRCRVPPGTRHQASRRCGPPPRASSLQDAPTKVVEVSPGGRSRAVDLGGGGSAAAPAAPAAAEAGPSDGPLAGLRAFFLPRGWPHSVTPDYLNYQLATVPAHVTGWCSHSLATSSMIAALGVSAGPAATVATSAAIKWITKDGLGAAGRLIVGGNLAQVFDEDPRRWRMVAEGITTLGLALEIATQVYPAQFVALAGAGTLAKSMAKGMARPCFRVIQTHFSATNNVGDVAAKEEVWEVAAQLAGLAASVALLQLLQAAGRPELAVPAWAAVHSAHVALRYAALAALRFPWPNQKRAAALVARHVSTGTVPSVDEANAGEAMLARPSACRPSVRFGCTLEEALGSGGGGGGGQQAAALQQLVDLYRGERYLLTWRDGTAYVLLQEEARPLDLLRAMWQAAWLEHQQEQQRQGSEAAAAAAANPSSSNGSSGSENGSSAGDCSSNGSGSGGLGQLAASLEALRGAWPGFVAAAEAQGWQLDRAVLPRGRTLVRLE